MKGFITDNTDTFIKCFEKVSVDGAEKFICRANSSCETQYSAKSSAIRHLRTRHRPVYLKIKKNRFSKLTKVYTLFMNNTVSISGSPAV